MYTAQHVNMEKALLVWVKEAIAWAFQLTTGGCLSLKVSADSFISLWWPEDGDVPPEVRKGWQSGHLRELLDQYETQNIYGAKGTGFFVKVLLWICTRIISAEKFAGEGNIARTG